MISLVIGMGEIGSALYKVLSDTYKKKVLGYDLAQEEEWPQIKKLDILHICIPDIENFVEIVNLYVKRYKPKYTIVHSSVQVGTTAKIDGASFHSPVRGKHPNMEKGLLTYKKYLSWDGPNTYAATDLSNYFCKAGITCKTLPDTKVTELGKLLALARYGVYLAFAKEQEAICAKYDVPYHKAVSDFEVTRTEGLIELGEPELIQPMLFPFDNFIGGHCTVEDMAILLEENDDPLLYLAHEIGRNTTIWDDCNIYDTAVIGKGCSIGKGCEIGHKVVIGNNVRIGAMTFIPEGVTIEDDVFIAPGVKFSNDKYPPSDRKEWGKICVKKNAMIGMGSIILPGVTIGERAFIGAGSIVTKYVPAGEKWYGNPAHAHGDSSNIS